MHCLGSVHHLILSHRGRGSLEQAECLLTLRTCGRLAAKQTSLGCIPQGGKSIRELTAWKSGAWAAQSCLLGVPRSTLVTQGISVPEKEPLPLFPEASELPRTWQRRLFSVIPVCSRKILDVSNGAGQGTESTARLAARISHSSRLLLPFQHLQHRAGWSTSAGAWQIQLLGSGFSTDSLCEFWQLA